MRDDSTNTARSAKESMPLRHALVCDESFRIHKECGRASEKLKPS